ncbi:MAG: lytic transglycosylase domain-containing protein, partial [Myxococcota bacterium]|nr:lytic transglycosylase domain-containing protein [Myxococcota bacterium]
RRKAPTRWASVAFRLGRRLGASRSPLGALPLAPDTLRAWRLAYPRAYARHVERAAGKQSLPSALLFGVMREESGFDPAAFSPAHAVGLMQLLAPTAERFAARAGIEGTVGRRRLQRPSVNVAIGAAYLRFLADRYPDRLALLPAAYNAGEARLDRWLLERGDLPLDRFIESIPFEQTRTYLMRVVSSWAAYHALWGDAPGGEPLPVVDPSAPARPD